ncbi:hypothetical protein SDC9_189246 [bioreactor metagenome]|uniref:CheW-like domain-containing protein n=1 Tax=bioreactor metagenome TaxID=1076179 RepID=A0A645HRN1_9ZZZZ
MGLIVDDVEEVAQIDGADIAPPPDMEALSSAYLLGVAKTGAGMVLLLNAERLWQRSV